ncbi:hypothetical protein [Schaalia cardiffensis]|uniref:hypothetical protein n=1 Tax=Schaalia cardiffensis TaxID=181487 RepID=UPI0023F1FFAB|nr:hypothetical protein [Schaalia cardiffensis]
MSMRDDDIDAEFRDLVAGLADSSQPDAVPMKAAEHTAQHGGAEDLASELSGLEAALKDPDDTPVDEQLHLDGGKLSVGLVLAPIPSPEALHALLGLTGIRATVVRLKPWTGVWLRVETTPTDEDELDALLNESRPMPDDVDAVARTVSRLSKYGAVAIMSWLVEGDGVEPGVSGRISAQRYVAGQPEEPIPAGVLLGSMPQATEDLLLGRTTPSDYSDSVLAEGGPKRRPGPFGFFKKR